ncbi:MAG: type II toxin-antitoxin system VapB family antitoxin [Candidatus Hydrogenedentes bacterium]|nr:type II toxin-antitoxin system VapB family antitoxin [Candidatus Hydrogenedentota bacterium]
MATNLQLDDALIARAVRLGKHKSKKDAVNKALLEYVEQLEQLKIIDAFGTIDFDPEYDYKAMRRRR